VFVTAGGTYRLPLGFTGLIPLHSHELTNQYRNISTRNHIPFKIPAAYALKSRLTFYKGAYNGGPLRVRNSNLNAWGTTQHNYVRCSRNFNKRCVKKITRHIKDLRSLSIVFKQLTAARQVAATLVGHFDVLKTATFRIMCIGTPQLRCVISRNTSLAITCAFLVRTMF
jgi:hypothetical protein